MRDRGVCLYFHAGIALALIPQKLNFYFIWPRKTINIDRYREFYISYVLYLLRPYKFLVNPINVAFLVQNFLLCYRIHIKGNMPNSITGYIQLLYIGLRNTMKQRNRKTLINNHVSTSRHVQPQCTMIQYGFAETKFDISTS